MRSTAGQWNVDVFPRPLLARTLGVQYIAGGLLAGLWLLMPRSAERGTAVVAAMAVMAALLGVLMLAAARRQHLGSWVCHAAIVTAQPVIGVAVVATGDPGSPLLYFWMWTVPYAGVFGRQAGVLHLAWTAVVLGVTLASVPAEVRSLSPGSFLLVFATSIVLGLLVQRLTGWLSRRATHDSLTGLANRALFLSATKAALARRRGDGVVAVLLLDLDRFKVVNDTFGHQAGDHLLRAIAPRLQAAVRDGDLVARLGGDEFAVLVEDPTGGVDPEALGHRLAAAWAEPLPLPQGTVYTSGSVGVAVAGADGQTPASLLCQADAAMYQGKALGPGHVSVYDAEMRVGSDRRLVLERALREALDRGELHLAYQPVVRLRDEQVTGAEALLRWANPDLGHVSPADFIPLAEETGLVVPIGAWVLEQAVADLSAWRAAGAVDASFTVAVNVSAPQLTPELPGQVAEVLARHGVPGTALGLEITESALLSPVTAAPVLAGLKELGITLLLDDFGTGFSSLSHLQQFPFDVLKIDRSFVADLCEVPRQRSIVMAILSMADALGLDVVAEGIESRAQARELAAARCGAGQGYLFSRPVPGAELVAVVERHVAPVAAGVPAPRAGGQKPRARPVG